MKHDTNYTIVGGGLAGALMACYLGKAGHEVNVYERRPDLRGGKAPAGKSINLAISERGIAALRRIGLAERVLDRAVPMRGRMIHSPEGRLSFQPYSKNPNDAINSVSRGGLNAILLEKADSYPNVTLHYEHKCIDVDLDAAKAQFEVGTKGELVTAEGDVIVGADGAFSAVRAKMQHLDRFDFRQDYLRHGYKELVIPPGEHGTHRIEKNALHIWPRRSYMMIALPNEDGSFTCTLFWPFDGPHSFAAVEANGNALGYFKTHFQDAVPVMPTLAEDYARNPTNSLVTVRCGPWNYKDKAVLVGDAAHAVVPFYGQGMNAAFGDCIALDECLAAGGADRADALAEYYRQRKTHIDALADLAIGNFVEMRDHAGSPGFRFKKWRERTLHTLLPGWYTPLYNMISFSQVPYGDALKRARRQDRIVRWVCGAAALIVAVVVLWILLTRFIG
ncbi:MAG: FAD-dependent monooxygenase [Planctomycetes bacterium]|nr:FAD-dependent monooxygenase [Planctomycetota bacterium]